MGFTRNSIGLCRVFALPALRLTALAAAMILGLCIFAGAVRVLPLLLEPTVSLRLAVPLARGVLGMSLETALIIAPPLAWALSAANLVERGEARALAAIGVRPSRIVASAWPAALAVAAATSLAALSWGREAIAPGRLVRELVADARAACVDASSASDTSPALAAASPVAQRSAPAVVNIPSLGFSWVCFPGREPRIIGPAPLRHTDRAGARDARDADPRAPVLQASSIHLSDDLRSIHLQGATLAMPPSAPPPLASSRLHAADVAITGLAPLGRASNISVPLRALLLSVSAVTIAALAAVIVLALAVRSRALALATGLAGPSAALMAFSALERSPAPRLAYAAVPIAGLFALVALFAGASALSRTLRGIREDGTG